MMFNGDVGVGGEKRKKEKKDSLAEDEKAVREPLVAKRGHAEGGRVYGAGLQCRIIRTGEKTSHRLASTQQPGDGEPD